MSRSRSMRRIYASPALPDPAWNDPDRDITPHRRQRRTINVPYGKIHFPSGPSRCYCPDRDMPQRLDTSADVGSAVRAARRRRRLTLNDLALGAGVGVRFLSELERGKPTARLAETLRVASALGLEIVVEDPLEHADA